MFYAPGRIATPAVNMMKKPDVYIIEKGRVGEPEADAKLGEGAYSISTTVGMIEFEKQGDKKFMLVDTGMAASFENIRNQILKHGELSDVTHILMTHFDYQGNDKESHVPRLIP